MAGAFFVLYGCTWGVAEYALYETPQFLMVTQVELKCCSGLWYGPFVSLRELLDAGGRAARPI